jgi:membrane protease subunit HflC
MKGILALAAAIVALLVIYNLVAYTVDETQQAVVVQLGEIVQVNREPGLYFKTPFLQSVIYLEDRILSYDIQPREVITSDKKRVTIDNYALWRIADPRQFVETMGGSLVRAQGRLDDVVYSNLRDVLAKQTLEDIIKREQMTEVTGLTQQQVRQFGMEIIDVRIKRADLPAATAEAVYNRMISERQQIAARYRAEGDQEAQRIRSQAEREKEIILAEARKRAQELMGEGDAQALEIYANAYNRDISFYRFWRTLESYKATLKEGDTVVLSTDSEYLRFLERLSEKK